MESGNGLNGEDHPNSSTDVSGEMSEQEELPDIDYYHPVFQPAPANSIQTEYPEKCHSEDSMQNYRRRSNSEQLLDKAGPNKRKKLERLFLLQFDWFNTKQKFGGASSPPSRTSRIHCSHRRENTNSELRSQLDHPHNQNQNSTNTKEKSEIQSRRSKNSPKSRQSPVRPYSTPSNSDALPNLFRNVELLPKKSPNTKLTTQEPRHNRETSQKYPQVQNYKSTNLSYERTEIKDNVSTPGMFEFMHKVPTGYTIPKRSNGMPIPT